MTEKRFTSDIHRIFDNDEEIACADTMDDAEILVDRLNEQEERIKELETVIQQILYETILKQKRKMQELETRNKRQYNRLKELTELMYERQWGKLENMVEEWEKADELLEQEWNNCEDL